MDPCFQRFDVLFHQVDIPVVRCLADGAGRDEDGGQDKDTDLFHNAACWRQISQSIKSRQSPERKTQMQM